MRAKKSRSLLQSSTAATTVASGGSANPGASAGNPSDASTPRDSSIWCATVARPSARLRLRNEGSDSSSSGP